MNREELIAKRDELTERLNAIRRDLGRGLDRDSEEQAMQLENHDTLMEIARVSEQELLKVRQQLSELGD
ncbi:MAG: hypothetical protein AAF446_01505 [Pseudomonadota bacterium]